MEGVYALQGLRMARRELFVNDVLGHENKVAWMPRSWLGTEVATLDTT